MSRNRSREDRTKTKERDIIHFLFELFVFPQLIVRHLPPELSQDAFRAAVDVACPYPWEEDIAWWYFVQGQQR